VWLVGTEGQEGRGARVAWDCQCREKGRKAHPWEGGLIIMYWLANHSLKAAVLRTLVFSQLYSRAGRAS
jgi:hypothetical protein